MIILILKIKKMPLLNLIITGASCEEPGKIQKATVMYKTRDFPGVGKE